MANPYAQMQGYLRNPFGPQDWGQWAPPTDETSRAFYSKNPQGAMALFSRAAGGTPGGSLEQFMKMLAATQYDQYIADNLKPGGENLFYTDRLTPALRDQGWRQWQSQTAYQRGENYANPWQNRRV